MLPMFFLYGMSIGVDILPMSHLHVVTTTHTPQLTQHHRSTAGTIAWGGPGQIFGSYVFFVLVAYTNTIKQFYILFDMFV